MFRERAKMLGPKVGVECMGKMRDKKSQKTGSSNFKF